MGRAPPGYWLGTRACASSDGSKVQTRHPSLAIRGLPAEIRANPRFGVPEPIQDKDTSRLQTVCIVYCSDTHRRACAGFQRHFGSAFSVLAFARGLDCTMARTQWLVDGKRIAMKVMNATHLFDLQKNLKSDANIACPNCNYQIDNSDVAQEWPGLPAGVKFVPSDQELLQHLAGKIRIGNARPHAFIDEFISTLDGDLGICCTHPEKLPGVKQDGSPIHFFHRTTRAYTRGTRKRRKIHNAEDDVRWHKTGKTKPVFENGEQKGCKKIMVLYMTSAKGSKAEKTNWVMHQYHLGIHEDEEEGELVVSKVFYQKQQRQTDKDETEAPEEDMGACINKGGPVTPKTSTPPPPRSGEPCYDLDVIEEEQMDHMDLPGQSNEAECEKLNGLANATSGYSACFAGESQCLDDSQQLMDEYLFCNEKLENRSSEEKIGVENCVQSASECGRLQSDEVERDLYPQPHASAELAKIELDTPPEGPFIDFQFSSQESISAWLTKNTDWLLDDKSSSKPGENLGDSQCST